MTMRRTIATTTANSITINYHHVQVHSERLPEVRRNAASQQCRGPAVKDTGAAATITIVMIQTV